MMHIRHVLQAFFLFLLMSVFRCMSLDRASAFGSWLGRSIGLQLGANRKAYKNLAIAFPHATDAEKKKIIRDMWDNIGRTVGEYAHLRKIGMERIKITNESVFHDVVAANHGAIFISAHLANWEINATTMYARFNLPLNVTYRAPNNPYVARMLDKIRSLNGKISTFPKHRSSGKDIMQALKDKGYVGILIDQKYNEGVAVPFFGVNAMTNPIFVRLAQKYKCPVVPVQNIRLDGAHFESRVYPPLTLFDDAGEPLPVETVIAEAHALLERWIAENPGQWLWLHRRWPRETYKALS